VSDILHHLLDISGETGSLCVYACDE